MPRIMLAATLSTTDWLVLPAIGLAAGVLGGALGVGGGLVMIPAMLLALGETRFGSGSLHLYKLSALAAAIVLSIFAARQHIRARVVVMPIVRSITLGAIFGVVAGAALGSRFSQENTHILRRVFGGFMLLVVASYIWRLRLGDRARSVASCPCARRWRPYALFVGAPSGLISGLLGVGGGVWAVPAMHYGLGLRLSSAIGNSSTMIVGVATAAAVVQSVFVYRMPDLFVTDGWVLAALLAPGALVGGQLGGRLTHHLPASTLRHAFHALLAVTGLKLLGALDFLG